MHSLVLLYSSGACLVMQPSGTAPSRVAEHVPDAAGVGVLCVSGAVVSGHLYCGKSTTTQATASTINNNTHTSIGAPRIVVVCWCDSGMVSYFGSKCGVLLTPINQKIWGATPPLPTYSHHSPMSTVTKHCSGRRLFSFKSVGRWNRVSTSSRDMRASSPSFTYVHPTVVTAPEDDPALAPAPAPASAPSPMGASPLPSPPDAVLVPPLSPSEPVTRFSFNTSA